MNLKYGETRSSVAAHLLCKEQDAGCNRVFTSPGHATEETITIQSRGCLPSSIHVSTLRFTVLSPVIHNSFVRMVTVSHQLSRNVHLYAFYWSNLRNEKRYSRSIFFRTINSVFQTRFGSSIVSGAELKLIVGFELFRKKKKR